MKLHEFDKEDWEGVSQENGGSALVNTTDGQVALSVVNLEGVESIVCLDVWEATDLMDALNDALHDLDQERD